MLARTRLSKSLTVQCVRVERITPILAQLLLCGEPGWYTMLHLCLSTFFFELLTFIHTCVVSDSPLTCHIKERLVYKSLHCSLLPSAHGHEHSFASLTRTNSASSINSAASGSTLARTGLRQIVDVGDEVGFSTSHSVQAGDLLLRVVKPPAS